MATYSTATDLQEDLVQDARCSSCHGCFTEDRRMNFCPLCGVRFTHKGPEIRLKGVPRWHARAIALGYDPDELANTYWLADNGKLLTHWRVEVLDLYWAENGDPLTPLESRWREEFYGVCAFTRVEALHMLNSVRNSLRNCGPHKFRLTLQIGSDDRHIVRLPMPSESPYKKEKEDTGAVAFPPAVAGAETLSHTHVPT